MKVFCEVASIITLGCSLAFLVLTGFESVHSFVMPLVTAVLFAAASVAFLYAAMQFGRSDGKVSHE